MESIVVNKNTKNKFAGSAGRWWFSGFILLLCFSLSLAAFGKDKLIVFKENSFSDERDFVINHHDNVNDFNDLNKTGKSSRILISQLDLNDDGKQDFIASIESELHCGGNGIPYGCTTQFFVKKDNKNWELVFSVLSYGDIEIMPQKTLGYHSIKIFKGPSYIPEEYDVFVWEGNSYKLLSSHHYPTDRAHKLKFSATDHAEEREIALKKINQLRSSFRPEQLLIDLYDLNGDGLMDIFAYDNRSFCPRSGCFFMVIMQEKGRNFRILFEKGLNNKDYISILPSKNNEYHDLFYSGKFPVVHRWNGKEYGIFNPI